MSKEIPITTYPPAGEHEVLGLVFGHGRAGPPKGAFSKAPDPRKGMQECEQELRKRAVALGANQVCGVTVTYNAVSHEEFYTFHAADTAVRVPD